MAQHRPDEVSQRDRGSVGARDDQVLSFPRYCGVIDSSLSQIGEQRLSASSPLLHIAVLANRLLAVYL